MTPKPKPTPPPPAPAAPVAVDAVRVVRPADPPTCKGDQPHDWRYQYGVPRRTFPPMPYPTSRVERFHCAHCTAIEDREVPPLDGRADGPQFGGAGS